MVVEDHTLPTTPKDFSFRDVTPGQALKELWKHITGRKVKCPECGETFKREKIYEENFQPIIEKDDIHLLYQIDNWKELYYIECPECGEYTEVKGGISRTTRERNWS